MSDYDKGFAAGVAASVKVCEERAAHFKRMAISSASTTWDEPRAHEAGECGQAIRTWAREASQEPCVANSRDVSEGSE